jgi:PRTRC genetic system ThiF family protein
MKERILHRSHSSMLKLELAQPLDVVLVGCGGNGSKLLSGLRHLHHAMQALGHWGLHVTAYDPDTVSESNLARQSFYESDIGLNKAVVLINRLNLACGLNWTAKPQIFDKDYGADIVISCVDSRAARAQIRNRINNADYWLDLGNNATSGQVVLGTMSHKRALASLAVHPTCHLPTAAELFPEIVNTRLPEQNTPSCSTLEALTKQDLFINDAVVQAALNILWRLVRHKVIDFHGAFVNLETGLSAPIKVKPYTLRHTKRNGYLAVLL